MNRLSHLDICRLAVRANFVFSPLRLSAFGASQTTEGLVTLTHRQKGRPVVVVHPPVQDGIDERRAHGHDVKHGVKQLKVLHVQHGAVDVDSELEGVERQPADGEHHHHGQQHLSCLLPALVAVIPTPGSLLQLIPDPNVGDGNDNQG